MTPLFISFILNSLSSTTNETATRTSQEHVGESCVCPPIHDGLDWGVQGLRAGWGGVGWGGAGLGGAEPK